MEAEHTDIQVCWKSDGSRKLFAPCMCQASGTIIISVQGFVMISILTGTSDVGGIMESVTCMSHIFILTCDFQAEKITEALTCKFHVL